MRLEGGEAPAYAPWSADRRRHYLRIANHRMRDERMRFRKLGNTGLIVSEMCLGAMTFGSGEGMWATVAGVSQEGVTDLIKTAFDRGINFIDTADFYSNGRSEVVTGNALKMLGLPRDSYVLATKVLLRMGAGPQPDRPLALRTSCRASTRA